MALGLEKLVYEPANAMLHGGLPVLFAEVGLLLLLGYIALTFTNIKTNPNAGRRPGRFNVFAWLLNFVFKRRAVLMVLRILIACVFVLIIVTGLFGTANPKLNLATVLTWTVWWSLIVAFVLIVGSAWCSVCPWDTLASWIAKQTLWLKSKRVYSLALTVPKAFRNISVATGLFILLSWFELGWGMTKSPQATAILAIVFVMMATVSMLLFERKAFCQYFCPIGRTLGMYGKLSVTRLDRINPDHCAACQTLECYHGSSNIEACPTHVTLGLAKDHSYCISCGNCVWSCPGQQVSWQAQSPVRTLQSEAKINRSEAYFIITLLALGLFHGITMLPIWERWVSLTALWINDSGRLLWTFSLYMLLCLLLVTLVYYVFVYIANRHLNASTLAREFRRLSIILLPLAIGYHIAHNLTHFANETRGFLGVLMDPFGTHATASRALTMSHEQTLGQMLVYVIQTSCILIAGIIAVKLAKNKLAQTLTQAQAKRAHLSLAIMIFGFVFLSYLLLIQPMIMRH